MTSIKNFFAVTLGILGALILAPFVAFFGLMMLGLSFGLALIGAAVVTYAARATQEADVEDATFEAAAEEPVDLDTSATQPA
ncbi:hypothetical protein [Cognatiyoonia sp.]|uniref:hypothetical protein n=1 Tax=Cognatiyoonia sp. TaxID=2211652 RepID=UPI003F69A0B6